MNVRYSYLGHSRLEIEDDVVFRINVLIEGPVSLQTADNTYWETLTCDVFVQQGECRSESKNDLLRCAVRRVKELAKEAHKKARQETL